MQQVYALEQKRKYLSAEDVGWKYNSWQGYIKHIITMSLINFSKDFSDESSCMAKWKCLLASTKKVFLLLIFFACSCNHFSGVPPKVEHIYSLHVIAIHDPFSWMCEYSPRALRFARAENRKVRRAIRKTRHLHREFFNECI